MNPDQAVTIGVTGIVIVLGLLGIYANWIPANKGTPPRPAPPAPPRILEAQANPAQPPEKFDPFNL